MPVGPFFADFLCRELKLVIELDGFSHDLAPERDVARDRWMKREGYTVLRFANAEVHGNLEGVVTAIGERIARLRMTGPPLKKRFRNILVSSIRLAHINFLLPLQFACKRPNYVARKIDRNFLEGFLHCTGFDFYTFKVIKYFICIQRA